MKSVQCIPQSTRFTRIWHGANAGGSFLRVFVVGLALAVSLPIAGRAGTVTVPSGSIVNIQDGINAAAPGDKVSVQAGIYSGGCKAGDAFNNWAPLGLIGSSRRIAERDAEGLRLREAALSAGPLRFGGVASVSVQRLSV